MVNSELVLILTEVAEKLIVPLSERIARIEDALHSAELAGVKERWHDHIEPVRDTLALLSGKTEYDPYEQILSSGMDETQVLSALDQVKQMVVKAAEALTPGETATGAIYSNDNCSDSARVEAIKAEDGSVVVTTTESTDGEKYSKTTEVVPPAATITAPEDDDARYEADLATLALFNRGGKAKRGK